jgi:putative addiction module killer protein
MGEVREDLDRNGRGPYAECFSNVRSVGSGVHECKIKFGSGYRVYFGENGESLVILLGGGTKKRQQRDINYAIATWQDYKIRKK